jgi:metal-responsive CopG/Arc/MetJ family transcriptional regulator
MKTIAITIDEGTLSLLDEVAAAAPRKRSRSALIRAAVRDFAERERLRVIEDREREILHRHRKRLARQARLLIAEQARP